MDDAILRRRSIRAYTQEPVTDAQVEALLRAAMAAPSAGNQQPWRFVVIRDKRTLGAITEVHPYAKMLPGASVAILVCGDPGAGKWPQYWEQDCAAATENVLIAAEQLGLGSVWLGVHPLAERVAGDTPPARHPRGDRAVRAAPRRPAGGAQGAGRPLRRGPSPSRALVRD